MVGVGSVIVHHPKRMITSPRVAPPAALRQREARQLGPTNATDLAEHPVEAMTHHCPAPMIGLFRTIMATG
jgi:hypothetical protein